MQRKRRQGHIDSSYALFRGYLFSSTLPIIGVKLFFGVGISDGRDNLKTVINEVIIKIRLETALSYVKCEYPMQEKIKIGRECVMKNLMGHVLSISYANLVNNIDPYTTF